MEPPPTSILAFCERMLDRVRNTEQEAQWRHLEKMLLSNTLSAHQQKRVNGLIEKTKIKHAQPQSMPTESTEPKIDVQKAANNHNNIISKSSDQVALPVIAELQLSGVKKNRLQSPLVSQSTENEILSVFPATDIEEIRTPEAETSKVRPRCTIRLTSVKNVDHTVAYEKSKEPSFEPITPQHIENTSEPPSPPLLVEVVTPPLTAKAADKSKTADQHPTEHPPIKLKLGSMFKRHAERIRKQRDKRLKQVKADRIRDQLQTVQKAQPSEVVKVLPSHVAAATGSTSSIRKRRESILKPKSLTSYFEKYNLRNCSVNLSQCASTTMPSPQKLTADVEKSVVTPEDHLNSEIEVKEEVVDSSRDQFEDHEPIKRKVARLSYTIVKNKLTMICLLCSFEHQDAKEFKKHLRSNHTKYRWYGNCSACGSYNYYRAATNIVEFDHMLKMHIEKEFAEICKTHESIAVEAQHPKPMVSIPRDLLPPPTPPAAVQKPGPIIANTTKRRLQPWLESTPLKEHKLEDVCSKMLNLNCLSALFKCMGVNCCFYTNDMTVFEKHLRLHFLFQNRGEASFMSCSYCNFKGKLDHELALHVNSKHGAAKYQCAYCFYRSYGPQVETHQFIYHYEKKPAMIKCIVSHKKNLKDVVQKITQEASSNLSPISCLICNSKHYSFNVYLKHLLTKHQFESTKCNKCSETVNMKTIINHFKTCFQFGNFQCCYCPFGTDSRQQYKVHLVKSHPIDLPLYFDRLNEPDLDNPQELLSIKRIPFVINEQPCLVHMSPRSDAIRNEENVEVLM